MAAVRKASAARVAKLLSEIVPFDSEEASQALMEYFCNSEEAASDVSSDSEDWGAEAPLVETDGDTDSEGNQEQEKEVDNQGMMIQAPLQLNESDCSCGEWSECFSNNAGKPDTQLLRDPTCKCKLYDGQPCYLQFSQEDLWEMRAHHLQLTGPELDSILLCQISSSLKDGPVTCCTKRVNVSRQKMRSQYCLNARKICRTLFEYIYAVGADKVERLMKHYRENGLAPRVHGNKNRMPLHALTFSDQQKVVDFVSNYAEVHGILLPGRIPGYSKDNLKLLPCSSTKAAVYQDYSAACATDGSRCVAKRTFFYLWGKYLPDILPMKPKTDLCWLCQKNSRLLQQAATLTDTEKIEAANKAIQHLTAAQKEREEYRRVVQKSKEEAAAMDLKRLETPDTNTASCTRDLLAHYSFDFAQQVHYPSDPLQPGPIYFKTPRKCAVFGMMTEVFPQMVLFLLDESVDTGKGANTVVSMVDFFFRHYGLKEKVCHLHADNCSGQNKNNTMLQYLMWRVITGQHESVTLSFLLPGHTKFGPDACFGVFKRKFRKTRVDSLDDIVSVAEKASSSGMLIPQLCGDQQGKVMVPAKNWALFLDQWFRKLVGLKGFHHFEFKLSDGTPEIHCRKYVDSDVMVFQPLKESVTVTGLPQIIVPTGMTEQRQAYLYQEIREFVGEEKRDLVCPEPQNSKKTKRMLSPPPACPQPSTSNVSGGTSRAPGRPRKKKRGLGAKKNID